MHVRKPEIAASRLMLVISLALAVLATWTDAAHAAIRTPTATGAVACGAPGTANITWSIFNYPEAPVPIVISSAEMSGAASGPVSIQPSSIPPSSTGTATVAVDGSAVGTVLLHASMTSPFETTILGQVTLDGSCAPVVTEPPPPPPPTDPPPAAVADGGITSAAGVQPTYVG